MVHCCGSTPYSTNVIYHDSQSFAACYTANWPLRSKLCLVRVFLLSSLMVFVLAVMSVAKYLFFWGRIVSGVQYTFFCLVLLPTTNQPWYGVDLLRTRNCHMSISVLCARTSVKCNLTSSHIVLACAEALFCTFGLTLSICPPWIVQP